MQTTGHLRTLEDATLQISVVPLVEELLRGTACVMSRESVHPSILVAHGPYAQQPRMYEVIVLAFSDGTPIAITIERSVNVLT